MTGHNGALTDPSKGRFFLFNKEQHGVMEKIHRKERDPGEPCHNLLSHPGQIT